MFKYCKGLPIVGCSSVLDVPHSIHGFSVSQVLCEIGAMVKLYTSILGVLGKIATSLWVTIDVYGIVDPVLGSSLGQKAQVQHSLVAASPSRCSVPSSESWCSKSQCILWGVEKKSPHVGSHGHVYKSLQIMRDTMVGDLRSMQILVAGDAGWWQCPMAKIGASSSPGFAWPNWIGCVKSLQPPFYTFGPLLVLSFEMWGWVKSEKVPGHQADPQPFGSLMILICFKVVIFMVFLYPSCPWSTTRHWKWLVVYGG